MFEYVVIRTYLDNKNRLKQDEKFHEYVCDTLESAIQIEKALSSTDPNGIYYIEHRIKLDYAGSN